jgi:hypothetical protein
MQSEYVFKVAD